MQMAPPPSRPSRDRYQRHLRLTYPRIELFLGPPQMPRECTRKAHLLRFMTLDSTNARAAHPVVVDVTWYQHSNPVRMKTTLHFSAKSSSLSKTRRLYPLLRLRKQETVSQTS